jgi:hypothetical protein
MTSATLSLRPHWQPLQWKPWLCPMALLLVSWIWVAALAMQPRPGDDVIAVVFPPWWTADRALSAAAAAGAAVVRAGAVSSILVVQPATRDGVMRLREAGAWFAIDPKAIGACVTN